MTDQVYKTHYPRIVRDLAQRFTREDVEECVDDAFLYLRNLEQPIIHVGAFVTAWRLKAVRLLVNLVRNETKDATVAFVAFDIEEHDVACDPWDDVDEQLDRSAFFEEVWGALSEQEQVVAALAMRGYAFTEIASMLGRSIHHIYVVAASARRRIVELRKGGVCA